MEQDRRGRPNSQYNSKLRVRVSLRHGPSVQAVRLRRHLESPLPTSPFRRKYTYSNPTKAQPEERQIQPLVLNRGQRDLPRREELHDELPYCIEHLVRLAPRDASRRTERVEPDLGVRLAFHFPHAENFPEDLFALAAVSDGALDRQQSLEHVRGIFVRKGVAVGGDVQVEVVLDVASVREQGPSVVEGAGGVDGKFGEPRCRGRAWWW